jgi:putative transposase
MSRQTRNRAEPEDVVYALHLYFLGLELRNTSKAISRFVTRSHTAIRDWIQKYKPERLFYRRQRISRFIVDETQIRVGSEYIWLWVATSTENGDILRIGISEERNMFVAERFLSDLIGEYGEHPVSTDGGRTWYPQACRFLKINHHPHSPYEESIIEREICST